MKNNEKKGKKTRALVDWEMELLTQMNLLPKTLEAVKEVWTSAGKPEEPKKASLLLSFFIEQVLFPLLVGLVIAAYYLHFPGLIELSRFGTWIVTILIWIMLFSEIADIGLAKKNDYQTLFSHRALKLWQNAQQNKKASKPWKIWQRLLLVSLVILMAMNGYFVVALLLTGAVLTVSATSKSVPAKISRAMAEIESE